MQGTPTDLYKNNVGFVELVGHIETTHHDHAGKFRRSSSTFSMLSHTSRTLSMDQGSEDSFEFEETDEGVQMEASSKGKVKGSLLLKYFRAGVKWWILIFLVLLFVFTQIMGSTVDYFVSIW